VTGSRVRNSSPASALPGLVSTAQSGLAGSKAGSSTSAAGPVPTAAKDSQVVRKPTPVSGKWMVEGTGSTPTGKTTAVAAGGRLTASELIQQQMQRDNEDSRLFMSPNKDEEFDEDEDESLVDSEDYRADEVGMTLDINVCEYTHQLLAVRVCMK
jgi:hypothetical protein